MSRLSSFPSLELCLYDGYFRKNVWLAHLGHVPIPHCGLQVEGLSGGWGMIHFPAQLMGLEAGVPQRKTKCCYQKEVWGVQQRQTQETQWELVAGFYLGDTSHPTLWCDFSSDTRHVGCPSWVTWGERWCWGWLGILDGFRCPFFVRKIMLFSCLLDLGSS